MDSLMERPAAVNESLYRLRTIIKTQYSMKLKGTESHLVYFYSKDLGLIIKIILMKENTIRGVMISIESYLYIIREESELNKKTAILSFNVSMAT